MQKSVVMAVLMLGLVRTVSAQVTVHDLEHLGEARPEAWAMHFVQASTVLPHFGTPELAAGEWALSLDLGSIPHLSKDQQRVGFYGTKDEDLNKSPVFGRGLLRLGLPWSSWLELGYTPPIEIDGVRSRDLFAAALGRHWPINESWSVATRLYGQHGRAVGDITCPRATVGPYDEVANPFGCVGPSRDRVDLFHYGADLNATWRAGGWRFFGGFGRLRSEPDVQIDAPVFSVIDRSRRVASDWLSVFTLGLGRSINARWDAAVELLHVPLDVQRNPDSTRIVDDDFTSLRLRLSWRARSPT